MKSISSILLVITIPLFACQNSHSGAAVPARIIDSTTESHAELVKTVSAALNNPAVTLADNALTSTSVLVIERKPHRDPNGNPVLGRDLSPKPVERFRLVLKDGHCLLIQESTSDRFTLDKTRCIAE